MWQKYGKSIFAALAAVLALLASVVTDGITAGEGVQLAIATATALTVYVAPNLTQWPWVKTTLGLAMAVLNGSVALLDGGLTTPEIINLVIIGIGALGVVVAPAQVVRHQAIGT